MRITLLSLLTAGLLVGGCSRTEATASTPPPAAPATGHGDTAAPVAAAGHAEPALREVTIPAGTLLAITLDTPVGSDTSRVEQPVAAHLARAVSLHGQTVVPSGSRVSGVVTDATRSAKVKGRAHVAVRFDSITPGGDDERYAIRTAAVARTAPATKQKDAMEIGAPAAGGAIIGAIVGGKKGALVGTAVGGGAGTAVVLSTRGKEVHLPKGTPLTLKLAAPVTIRVKG